ncbi:hypothetical protein AGMMS49992_29030 [Clostridia bacterium]|nr:hypothetical protein AGMMS49992_29030 [Clostridia bacterium]
MPTHPYRIAVYVAVFGGYDCIEEPKCKPDNIDYYVITDASPDKYISSAWKYVDISKYNDTIHGYSSRKKSRFFKMHPQLLFSDYEYSVFLDGSFTVIGDLNDFIIKIGAYDLVTYKHWTRHCVYEEAKAIIKQRKDTLESVNKHIKHLKRDGMPYNYGLISSGILARRHTSLNKQIMDFWWDECSKFSIRDQLSLPYVLYKLGIPVGKITKLGIMPMKGDSYVLHQKHCKKGN